VSLTPSAGALVLALSAQPFKIRDQSSVCDSSLAFLDQVCFD